MASYIKNMFFYRNCFVLTLALNKIIFKDPFCTDKSSNYILFNNKLFKTFKQQQKKDSLLFDYIFLCQDIMLNKFNTILHEIAYVACSFNNRID